MRLPAPAPQPSECPHWVKSVGIDASLHFRSTPESCVETTAAVVGSGHLRTLAALHSHAPKQLILLWEMR